MMQTAEQSIETVSTVYFAESDYFNRNLLGKIGWLRRREIRFD